MPETILTRLSAAGGVALIAIVIALAVWLRQAGAGQISSSTVPVATPASHVVPAAQTPGALPVAGSASTTEPASALPSAHTDPVQVPSVPNAEPRLTVITEPVGARVTVNGIGWGSTPVTIRYLEPGPKRVRVTREGYRAEERLVEVGTSGSTTTRIPMRTAN